MPSSSPTGELTCTNFNQAAAHMLTYAHDASLNVGTNNDTAPTFLDMNEAMGVLTAMAPECAPKAVGAIAAMGVSAGEVAGVAAWTAMGKDPTAWDTALQFVE
jgi:hypothetical protein